MPLKWMSIGAITLAALSGCASNVKPFPGAPTVAIKGATPEQAEGFYSNWCLSNGGRLVSSSNNQVVCAKVIPMDTYGMLYRGLMTERYASDPETNFQFSWARFGGDLRVYLSAWVEHQNAYGKTTRNYLNQDSSKHELQAVAEKSKIEFESQIGASPSASTTASPPPTVAPAPSSPQPAAYGKSKEQRLEELRSQALPYEEYQRRYQQIMSGP
ncbi:TPA: hypothetical protein SL472_003592 [Pseudomonas aeruginosa]|nr:hypothetical protein [Pseudomonas aeruginosa]